jgi:murein L,D-transpeptidase YafK
MFKLKLCYLPSIALIGLTLLTGAGGSPAAAFSIELKAAAPQRIERQRAYTLKTPEEKNVEPDGDAIKQRLSVRGLDAGSAVFLRIFKAESQLELWIRKRDRFVLYRSYPICFWSGKLGPKLREGDGQTPEGFYTITRHNLHWSARWARSLNLGFPNQLDKRNGRTGSYILIHGGCSSIGCFSMTNHVMSEIHYLVRTAIKAGQRHVHAHVFPFRMTAANLRARAQAPWIDFWRDLKPAFDRFEKTRRPPMIAICGKRYVVHPDAPAHAGTGPIRTVDTRGQRNKGSDAGAPHCPTTTTATDERNPKAKAPL